MSDSVTIISNIIDGVEVSGGAASIANITASVNESTSVTANVTVGGKGDKGDTGDTGPQGIQGVQGPQGDQGIQGVQGDPGTSSRWYWSEGSTPDYTDVPSPSAGDHFLYPSSGDVFGYNGSTWVYEGSIKGATGATGATGPQGAPGVVQSVNGQSAATVTLTQDDVGDGTTYKQFSGTEKTKLSGIETGADVTDTANVTAAGALMDSEVDADIKTLSLPANTTISTFGASLVDDADASTARTTLGLGTIATVASPSGTVVGTTDTQTLTNKTLTVPLIDTISEKTSGNGVTIDGLLVKDGTHKAPTTYYVEEADAISLSTSHTTVATMSLPAVTAAHKYLINANFIANNAGGASIDYNAYIRINGSTVKQTVTTAIAGSYTFPIPMSMVFTSSASGGQTVTFTLTRSSGTGGMSHWGGTFTIVDLGMA